MDDEFFIGIIIVFIVIYLIYKLKKPKRKPKDFRLLIPYAADFLAHTPTQHMFEMNDVLYSELTEFIGENPYMISSFCKTHDTSISFNARINTQEYKVNAFSTPDGRLILIAKTL